MAKQRYWLFKSEPGTFSIDDLAAAERRTTMWDGVRNYQARNLLRDEIRVGDGVLFYHSSCPEPAVVGTCKVVKAGYPDHTQFDPADGHYDPKADPADPRWFMVDIELTAVFAAPVTLKEIRSCPELAEMALCKRGQRLSVQPVTAQEWAFIRKRGGRR